MIWFGLALLLSLAVSILATEAFLGGFEAVAEQGEQASWSGLGFEAGATMGPDGKASSIEFGGSALLLLPVARYVE